MRTLYEHRHLPPSQMPDLWIRQSQKDIVRAQTFTTITNARPMNQTKPKGHCTSTDIYHHHKCQTYESDKAKRTLYEHRHLPPSQMPDLWIRQSQKDIVRAQTFTTITNARPMNQTKPKGHCTSTDIYHHHKCQTYESDKAKRTLYEHRHLPPSQMPDLWIRQSQKDIVRAQTFTTITNARPMNQTKPKGHCMSTDIYHHHKCQTYESDKAKRTVRAQTFTTITNARPMNQTKPKGGTLYAQCKHNHD